MREIQIKNTIKHHLALSSKILQIANAGEDVEKREPSHVTGGNVNWWSHYGEQYEGPFKQLNVELSYDSAILLWGIYPEKTLLEKIHELQCS